MTNKTTVTIFACLVALLLGAATAQAQTEMDVSYQWTAPVGGSTVEFYVVQHSVNGGTWTQVATTTTNSYTLTATVGESHQIRVAGVDAATRQGPWSDPSDPYAPDPGAPAKPGQPIVF